MSLIISARSSEKNPTKPPAALANSNETNNTQHAPPLATCQPQPVPRSNETIATNASAPAATHQPSGHQTLTQRTTAVRVPLPSAEKAALLELSVKELRGRAQAAGVSEDALVAAWDGEDPVFDLIKLILQQEVEEEVGNWISAAAGQTDP